MNVQDADMKKMRIFRIRDTTTGDGPQMVRPLTRENAKTPVVRPPRPRITISTVGIGRQQPQLCVITAVAVTLTEHREETASLVDITRQIPLRLAIQSNVI